mmetsp:Transcript_40685/g.105614  ORF Transcript_40685/g.105614 Transcript_40685/m.105614 type:complete len:86 (+) Transcript_40685:459-716(+)
MRNLSLALAGRGCAHAIERKQQLFRTIVFTFPLRRVSYFFPPPFLHLLISTVMCSFSSCFCYLPWPVPLFLYYCSIAVSIVVKGV